MGNHHNGGVLRLTVGFDIAQNFRPAYGIQAGGGLVQNQHLRLHGNDSGDGHPTLLTAGQVKGRDLQLRLRQAYKARGLPDTAVNLFFVQTHILGAEGNVPVDRLLKELILRVLEHQSHPEPGLPGQLLVRPDVHPVQKHLAGGGLQKAVHLLHQGGFSGACMSDNADKLSGFQGKGDIVQSLVLKGRARTVNVVEISYFQNWFQTCFLPAVRP